MWVSPELGDRIISSMLVNGDWNPDVIVIAAETARTSRQAIHTAQVVQELRDLGHTVNDDWTVDYREDE